MKRLLFPLLAAGLISSTTARAASADAIETPDRISYQGKIGVAGGALIGAGSPVNQDLTFRIWTGPTTTAATDRLWSEKITTTISEGEFSVMLGSGDAVNGEARLRNSFPEVFTGQNSVTTDITSKERYLGITIGTGTDEIFPRQKIVTTAFAFRAKVAEAVAATAVTTGMIANGAVTSTQLATDSVQTTQIKDANVTTDKIGNLQVTTGKIGDLQVTSGKIADANVTSAKLAGQDAATPGNAQVVLGAVSTEKLQNSAVTTAKLAGQDAATPGATQVVLGAVSTAKIQNGAVTAAKLDAAISGFWSNASPSVYRATGKVGIGVTAPIPGADLPSTAALLQIRDRPVDVGGLTDSPSVWIGSATNNGGSIARASETALLLSRAGVSGQAYANLARFDLSRWDTNSGTASRTQLDIRLSHGDLGAESNATPTVMSLKSDGSVAVAGKITSPMFKLEEPCKHQSGDWTSSNKARTGSYTSSGGKLLITVMGTGFNTTSTGDVEVCFTMKNSSAQTVAGTGTIDGIVKCSASSYRITFTRQFILQPTAGTYSLSWGTTGSNAAYSDVRDFSQVTVMELPF